MNKNVGACHDLDINTLVPVLLDHTVKCCVGAELRRVDETDSRKQQPPPRRTAGLVSDRTRWNLDGDSRVRLRAG